MRTVDTDWEWRNPQDVALEEHRPRRRQPAARRASKRRQRPPLLPTLTLLAAGAAAALSVLDLVVDDVGNVPAQVIVSPPDETTLRPAAPVEAQVLDAPTIDATDDPQYNPYEPPIGLSAPTVDECQDVPLIRGRLMPC